MKEQEISTKISLTGIMGNIGRRVEQPMDAVSRVVPDHTVAVRSDVLLDHVADLAESLAGLHDLDGFAQRFVGHFDQILVLLGHIANEKRFVQITMEVPMVNRYVHIAQITILRREELIEHKWVAYFIATP